MTVPFDGADDDPVMAGIRSGQPDWAAVFDRYYNVMYAAANSILKGQAALGVDAEDCVSVAFRQVMRDGIPQGVRQPHSYLAEIARRRAVDNLRRRRHQSDSPVNGDTPRPPGSPEPELPEEIVAGSDLAAEITEQLGRLPPRHRTALVEYKMRERPREEVAAELGVTPQRVSQLVNEALAKLRALPAFAPGGPFDPSGGSMDSSADPGSRT